MAQGTVRRLHMMLVLSQLGQRMAMLVVLGVRR